MKIPKYIEKAVYLSAKHRAIANENNEKVRKWLCKNNLLNDFNIDQLIDCIENGNEPGAFINHIESTNYTGNNPIYNNYDED